MVTLRDIFLPAGGKPFLASPSSQQDPATTYSSDAYHAKDEYASTHEVDGGYYTQVERPTFDLNLFKRPTASSQLDGVAQYPRLAASSVSPHSPFSNNILDSPPPSILPRSTSSQPPPPPSHLPPQTPSNEIIPDRLLLSPPEPKDNAAPGIPSSRRSLTRALELARDAVRIDSTNDDPHGAIQAYGQSVALLKEVMERVTRGEDSTEPRKKKGHRRSIVSQEEEVRRLRSIVRILSFFYYVLS